MSEDLADIQAKHAIEVVGEALQGKTLEEGTDFLIAICAVAYEPQYNHHGHSMASAMFDGVLSAAAKRHKKREEEKNG